MKNKILIVDDIASNLDVLIELLRDKYEIFVAMNCKKTLEILENVKIDLILLDIMIPDIDGYEICKKIKNNNKIKDIPIIFITAKTDEKSIEEAYKVGGIDYITKPFKGIEVLYRIETQLKLQNTIQELNKTKIELEQLATKDYLTGLYNRRSFENILTSLIEISKREFNDMSIIMIDIDYFKSINDTYGHLVGDKILIELTKEINALIRKSDIFTRFGGEEFIILLPNTNLENAIQLAEKLRSFVENKIFKIDELSLQVTISIGIATFDKNNDNLFSLLSKVDKSLYKAKQNGRNRIEVFGS